MLPLKEKLIHFTKEFPSFLLRHWFIVGLFLVIGLAAAYPPLGKDNGYLHSEITVTYVAVGFIFLLSGMSLKTKALTEALLYWRLILLVQVFSFVAIPA
ncbi:hypothetical protein HDU91_001845, partial [Kappamyces sp. JEL0680]